MKAFRKFLLALIAICWAFTGSGFCAQGVLPRSAAYPPSLPLKTFVRMDQKTFDQNLRQLHQAVERPNATAPVDRETLSAIAGKLRQTDESTPDYWPTVLAYLPYASAKLAPHAPPPGQPPRALSDILAVGIMRGIREEGKTILIDQGPLGNGTFIGCRVIFTQNAVEMQKVAFRNCAFELPAAIPPSTYVKKVCRLLLTSGVEFISISSLR